MRHYAVTFYRQLTNSSGERFRSGLTTVQVNNCANKREGVVKLSVPGMEKVCPSSLYAGAATRRHSDIASSRNCRLVFRETRWRWVLKRL